MIETKELVHWLNTWRCLCRQFSEGGDCLSCEKFEGGKSFQECEEAAHEIRCRIEKEHP